MIAENPHPWAIRLFGVAAFVGVAGWLVLLSLFIWWTVQPANLPTVVEPMPVLNPNREVPIGDTLMMRLQVSKTHELAPVASTRLLECESGNLVTLTSTPIQLPIGSYELLSDSITIPAKITPGDTCRAVIVVAFRINPLRTETARFESEPFLVLPPLTEED